LESLISGHKGRTLKRFSNILLIADTDTDYLAALRTAVTLAKNNQARLTVCAVIDTIPADLQMAITAVTPAELCDIAVEEKRDWLAEIVKAVTENGVSIEMTVLVGKPFIEIIRQVLRNGHDLIVKCAEGSTSLRDMLLGVTDMHLMRKCACPVWIIKPSEHPHYRRILAAVDQDPEDAVKDVLNRQILEMSTSLALMEASELHIVHVWRLLGEAHYARAGISEAEIDAMVTEETSKRRQWLKDLVNRYGAKVDKDVLDVPESQLHVIDGGAKHHIATKARDLDVDLVVMGTVAHAGIAGFFMGNTAESTLTQLNCSVLTIKPPGFVSPVTLDG
jgi:universal stress protein E